MRSANDLTGSAGGNLEQALSYCRSGEWAAGLVYLNRVAREAKRNGGKLPSLYYSYKGYAIAAARRQVHDGLRLCRHAVKIEFYQPENYLNLARTLLLAGDRGAAVSALYKGLAIDPDNVALRALEAEIGGPRRSPVLPFLTRGNPLNQLLGLIRHGLLGGVQPATR